ncbi:HNH endonuclease [Lysinibacillus sp. NPDC093712]|uniref:HNH endonuclease n=1 Tax=Lysinibacillus sp. NPDC093712 TaxID=3390579 RepID=UPI003CFDFB94
MGKTKSLPSRAQIAEYWRDKRLPNGDEVIRDDYEPSCWACKRWWHNEDESKLINDGNFKALWNHPKYILERCHIHPKALGGSNDVSNLFLMCSQCHEASPDTTNTNLFFEWVQKRTYDKMIKEHWMYDLVKELQSRGIEVSEFFNWYNEDEERWLDAHESMNTHGFKVVNSTLVAGYLSYYLENAV